MLPGLIIEFKKYWSIVESRLKLSPNALDKFMKIKLKILVYLLPLVVGLMTNLQAQTMRNDVISALGGSYQLGNSNLTIRQSLGQSTVIGSFANSSTILAQGFLRGNQTTQLEREKPFDVIPFPNSFSKLITFRFVQNHGEKTGFTIYDINGKKVFDKQLLPIDNEVQINLDHLAAGLYLSLIKSGNRLIQKRIIKVD
jgi:hypothetical protein